MNPVLQANIVRDAGGWLVCPPLPDPYRLWCEFQKEASIEQHNREQYRPGCGELVYVRGTNGGKMPCGARLRQLDGQVARYFCDHCRSA